MGNLSTRDFLVFKLGHNGAKNARNSTFEDNAISKCTVRFSCKKFTFTDFHLENHERGLSIQSVIISKAVVENNQKHLRVFSVHCNALRNC